MIGEGLSGFSVFFIKEPSNYQSNTVYVYLNQKVKVEQQNFKFFYMGTLFREVIFGFRFNSENIQNNIMYRSKIKFNYILLYKKIWRRC